MPLHVVICSRRVSTGQILSIVSTKWAYLVAVVIFEIGSVICGGKTSGQTSEAESSHIDLHSREEH